MHHTSGSCILRLKKSAVLLLRSVYRLRISHTGYLKLCILLSSNYSTFKIHIPQSFIGHVGGKGSTCSVPEALTMGGRRFPVVEDILWRDLV